MPTSRRSPIVSPPLSSTPLSRLIYILITLSVLLISYYTYRYTSATAAVSRGWWWWSLGSKKTPCIINGAGENGRSSCSKEEEENVVDVEDRINGLAKVLGIPSKELASAIADVVRERSETVGKKTSMMKKKKKKKDDDELELEEEGNEGMVYSVVSNFVEEDELD